MPTTKELIDSAEQLATETWENGEGLGGKVSKAFTKCAQRLRELDAQVKQQINDYGRGMAVADLMPKPDCVWKEYEDGNFETQCGNYFHFDEGNIKENNCKFCQYCGGAVKEST